MTTKTPKQAAFEFFLKNAGFSYNPATETPAKGKARCARELAKAERDASALGYTFEWLIDEDADNSWMDEELKAENQEAFWCACYDYEGTLRASLSGIFEPSHEYRRVVEAELAQEALESVK